MQFTDFEISDEIKDNLTAAEITTATEIQEKAIPKILAGQDIIGLAQTGTGKTFAFLIPILNDLLKKRAEGNDESEGGSKDGNSIRTHSLVLAPTRELVSQIVTEAKKIVGKQPIRVAQIIGGVDYQKQQSQLAKGVDIIVATPGRLIDFQRQRKANLEHVSFVVLDEADRMLDMGFSNDIKMILSKTPKDRQTLMFSATMPYEIYYLANKHMKEPVEINVSQDNITTENIDQHLYHLGRNEKLPYLVNMILEEESGLVLIFTNMRVFVGEIVNKLLEFGIPAKGISSLLPQKKRSRLMSDYREGKIKVLVATDVASRGIDVDGITHVYNYDLPQSAENYVHRIGRTARAGQSGTSISFCSEYDYEELERIHKFLGEKIPNAEVIVEKTKFPKGEFESLLPKRRERGERSGREDNRRGGRDRDQNRNRGERGRGGDRDRDRDRDRNRSAKGRDRNRDEPQETTAPSRSRKPRQDSGRQDRKNQPVASGNQGRQGKGRGDRDRGGDRNRNYQKRNESATAQMDGKFERIQHMGGSGASKPKKGLWARIKGIFSRS